MIKIISQKIFEESPLNTSATSPLANTGGETGAFRSSVFEINKSKSIVNFITHVWSRCSDLLIADWAKGPEGRQLILTNQLASPLNGGLRPDAGHLVETKHVSVLTSIQELSEVLRGDSSMLGRTMLSLFV